MMRRLKTAPSEGDEEIHRETNLMADSVNTMRALLHPSR